MNRIPSNVHRASFYLLQHWANGAHQESGPAHPIVKRSHKPGKAPPRARAKLGWLRRAVAALVRYQRNRRTVWQLSRMSDQQLADIGIDRAQVRAVAAGMANLDTVAEQREQGIQCRYAQRVGRR